MKDVLSRLMANIKDTLGVQVWVGGHGDDDEDYLGVALPDQRGAVISQIDGSDFEITVHPDVDGCLPCTERLHVQGVKQALEELVQIVLESQRNIPIVVPGMPACRIVRTKMRDNRSVFYQFKKYEPDLISSGFVNLGDCAMYVMYQDETPVAVSFMLENELFGPVLQQIINGRGDILYALAVHPEHRGRGLGTAFVQALAPIYPKMAVMSADGALNFWRTKATAMTEFPARSGRFVTPLVLALQAL